MKKIILGMVAAFALVSFLAPMARAEEAAGDKPAAEKTEKKEKKASKKAEKKADDKGAETPAK